MNFAKEISQPTASRAQTPLEDVLLSAEVSRAPVWHCDVKSITNPPDNFSKALQSVSPLEKRRPEYLFQLYLVQQFVHFWIWNTMKISSSYLLSVVERLFTLYSDIQHPKSPHWGSYMLLKSQLHATLKIRGRNNWYMFHSRWNIHWLIAFMIIFFISANCTEQWWHKNTSLH